MTTERINIIITEKGSRTVSRNINNIGKSATATQGAVQLLRRSLGLLGGALILTSAVRTLAAFSQEMSTVKAISQATGEEFDRLREKAKDLGATTRFSASEAAEGMKFLARAGFDANQVLVSIEGTLQLAQAGALGLGRAADIASNVLQGFRLEVDQTGRVVDVLAATANSSNTNVEQLGDAMKFVAPVAAGLGVSLEEAAAAAGTLSNAGLQASLAGTGLRRVLSELESPSTKTAKILKTLGINAQETRISQVGLTAALIKLRDAGVDTGLALEIFGDRGGPAFEVLSSSIPGLQKMTSELKNADGTAKRIADTMDDNLNGALFAVKSAFEAVVIAIGDLGTESFLTDSFRKLATVLRFVATNIDDVAAAAGVLAGAFLAMKLPVIIGLFKSLAVAIALNPIATIAIAVVALTAALTLMRDEITLNTEGTITLGDAMEAASTTIGTSLTEAVNSLGGSFENFDEIVASVINNFSKGLVILLATTNGVVKALGAAFDDFPRTLKAVARSAWNGFLALEEAALNTFITAINKALDFLGITKTFTPFDLGFLKNEGETAGQVLGTAFENGFNEVLINTQKVSAARRAKEALAGAGGGGGVPKAPGAPSAAGTTPSTGGGNAGKDFAALLSQLEEENDLLKLNSDERLVRQAIMAAEEQLQRDLTATEEAQVRALILLNTELQTQSDILQDIRGPQENFEKGQRALNALLASGTITTAEFNKEFRDLKITLLDTQTDTFSGFERGFLKAQRDMEDFASSSERLITDAFTEAQDVVGNFFKTGKFEADDFFRTMADNFLKLGTQQLFAGAFGGSDGSGGIGGLFSSLFGGGGGGGGGGIGGLVSGLLGFQNGGSFEVGPGAAAASIGGIDNRLIAFRAQDGEKVTVTPKNSSGNQQGPIQQVFNVTSPDANSFKRSQTQLQNKAASGLSRARGRR